jgi:hypothetical protein
MAGYDAEFHTIEADGCLRSAQVVLAHLRAFLPFCSSVDVGCGAGTWVKAMREAEVEDVVGIDGEFARPVLRIPPERFLARDLREPIALGRRFDLALLLDMAEHLPPERAPGFDNKGLLATMIYRSIVRDLDRTVIEEGLRAFQGAAEQEEATRHAG